MEQFLGLLNENIPRSLATHEGDIGREIRHTSQ